LKGRAGIAQSVWRLVVGWTIRGSNVGGGGIIRPRSDRPTQLPTQLVQGLFRGKAAGTWRWPPTPSSAEVKERVELYFYSTSGPSWPVIE